MAFVLRGAAFLLILASSARGEATFQFAKVRGGGGSGRALGAGRTKPAVGTHDGTKEAASGGAVGVGASALSDGVSGRDPRLAIRVDVQVKLHAGGGGGGGSPSPGKGSQTAAPIFTMETLVEYRAHSHEVFVLYDADGNGVIAGKEEEILISDLSCQLSIEYSRVVDMVALSEVGHRKDGKLEQCEFSVLMAEVAFEKRVSFDFGVDGKRFECSSVLGRSSVLHTREAAVAKLTEIHEEAYSAFRCFDKDGTGILESEEIIVLDAFIEELEAPLFGGSRRPDVQELQKNSDLDGKGIDYMDLDIMMIHLLSQVASA